MTFNDVTKEFPNLFLFGFCPGCEVPVITVTQLVFLLPR
jgi:hypothetical protein